MWIFIQSSAANVSLDYPQGIVSTENETQIGLKVSHGTETEVTWATSPKTKQIKFNLSGKLRPLTSFTLEQKPGTAFCNLGAVPAFVLGTTSLDFQMYKQNSSLTRRNLW